MVNVVENEPVVQPLIYRVNVSPNPAKGPVNVQFSLPEITDVHLAVYNSAGMKLLDRELRRVVPGVHRYTINLENSPAGVYFVEISNGKNWKARRTVIKLK
jgi:biotin synthase-like enzyme